MIARGRKKGTVMGRRGLGEVQGVEGWRAGWVGGWVRLYTAPLCQAGWQAGFAASDASTPTTADPHPLPAPASQFASCTKCGNRVRCDKNRGCRVGGAMRAPSTTDLGAPRRRGDEEALHGERSVRARRYALGCWRPGLLTTAAPEKLPRPGVSRSSFICDHYRVTFFPGDTCRGVLTSPPLGRTRSTFWNQKSGAISRSGRQNFIAWPRFSPEETFCTRFLGLHPLFSAVWFTFQFLGGMSSIQPAPNLD